LTIQKLTLFTVSLDGEDVDSFLCIVLMGRGLTGRQLTFFTVPLDGEKVDKCRSTVDTLYSICLRGNRPLTFGCCIIKDVSGSW
jgi:hypothetical protein